MYDNMRKIIDQFNSDAGIAADNNIDFGAFTLKTANEFSYTDPIDGSVNDQTRFTFYF